MRPVPEIRIPDIIAGMRKKDPEIWEPVADMLTEAWLYESDKIHDLALKLAKLRYHAQVMVDILDNKPVGLDEGDWAIVEKLRQEIKS